MFSVADLGGTQQEDGVHPLKGWGVGGLLTEDEANTFGVCGNMGLGLFQICYRCQNLYPLPSQSLEHFRTDVSGRTCHQDSLHMFILDGPCPPCPQGVI